MMLRIAVAGPALAVIALLATSGSDIRPSLVLTLVTIGACFGALIGPYLRHFMLRCGISVLTVDIHSGETRRILPSSSASEAKTR
jgi:hypothetical protein